METLSLFSSQMGPFWAFFGASIAMFFGGIGSAIGTGIAGQAATGLSAEKPELAMRSIILQALPGSQTIYGFVIALIIISGYSSVGVVDGLQIFVAGFASGLSGLFSGIYQGRVLAGSMNMIAKDQSTFGKAMIMGAVVETVAILGFLVSLLMIVL
jgi:V/A-type H+/Na+-transporting ATPase subunit K